MSEARYKTKSYSKTFHKGSEFSDIMYFVHNQIEVEFKEPEKGQNPMDVDPTSVHKYVVTVTKIEQ